MSWFSRLSLRISRKFDRRAGAARIGGSSAWSARSQYLLMGTAALVSAASSNAEPRWYRGNTHTHTWNSDGDAAPDEVVRWYRSNGYQFLVITDHEYITPTAPLQALLGTDKKFLLIPGQEISQGVTDDRFPAAYRPAHVTAIGIANAIMPIGSEGSEWSYIYAPKGTLVSSTYTRNIAAVRQAGGIAQINHPNFRWSISADDIPDLPDGTLFEVWNGHALAHNIGGVDASGRRTQSSEELWDVLLSRGRKVWAVGADDSHSFGRRESTDNPPGQAWIMVRAEELSQNAILAAIRKGDFYASNGVTIDRIDFVESRLILKIKPYLFTGGGGGNSDDTRFITKFIGPNGRILAEVPGMAPHHQLKPGDAWLRATVSDSRGNHAWVQPHYAASQ